MEGFNSIPKIIKDAVKIAAVATVGIMPGQLKGQDMPINPKHEISIENNEQIKSKIFNVVESSFKNGTIKKMGNTDMYTLSEGDYEIIYDLDANYDNKIDSIPTIEIEYTKGNSRYILEKGPNRDKDIVYNYKDNSLANATTKTYADFFAEKMVVLIELYGKNDTPVNFRDINDIEKQKMLSDINQLMEKEKSLQEEVSKIAQNIYQKIKSKNYPAETEDKGDGVRIVPLGMYTVEFSGKTLNVSFVDDNNVENNINFTVSGDTMNLLSTEKQTKKENFTLPGSEVKKILEGLIANLK